MSDGTRNKPKTKDLAALVVPYIKNAVGYEGDEVSQARERTIKYFDGETPDLPKPGTNRSTATSRDVSDVIGWIMPSLMRVFASGGNVVSFEPTKPGEEEQAEQATHLTNHLFMNRWDGYRLLWNGLHDACKLRNGIYKHWYDTTPEYTTEVLNGLTEEQYVAVAGEDTVDVLEYDKSIQQMPFVDPATGEQSIEDVAIYDVKVRVQTSDGKVNCRVVALENFGINEEATSTADCSFCYEREQPMRSDLIERGYDADLVASLPSADENDSEVELARQQGDGTDDHSGFDEYDKARELIDIYECYIKLDLDGDGVATWHQIIIGGGVSSPKLIHHEEWEDDLPFTDIVAEIVPHQWQGKAPADDAIDIQNNKTVVLRALQDNLNLQNAPYREVNVKALAAGYQSLNKEALTNPSPGSVIWKNGVEPALTWQVAPSTAMQAIQSLAVFDDVLEKRTGVSKASMALDPQALQGQSATAANIQDQNQRSQVELIARTLAEGGLKRLFRALYRLLVKYQEEPIVMRLRGEFVEYHPSTWNADLDVTVNVGLGTGSRDRDAAAISQLMSIQGNFMQMLGPDNPIAGIDKAANAAIKMTESLGMNAPDQFFGEVSKEELAQFMQQKAQQAAQAQQNNPAEMAKLQMEMAKMQQQAQLDERKLQQEIALKRQELQEEMALEREKLKAEIILEVRRMVANAQVQREGNAAKAMSGLGRPIQVGGDTI